MNVLLVPTLGYDSDMLHRLFQSVDHPIRYKILINNGSERYDPDYSSFARKWDWSIIHMPQNIGVAASWNLGPKLFPFEKTWLIVNDDQVFQPGALQRICEFADRNEDAPIIYVNEYDAYDIFVWTRVGVQTAGYFDENFYPAYFEDYEYRDRLDELSLQPAHICTDHSFPVFHGKPHPAGPNYMRMLEEVKPINEQYYHLKSGTVNWELDWPRREKLKAIWDKFWNKTPSVYT